MTKYWTLLLILPWLAVGCSQQAANQALEEAKVAEANAIEAAKIVPVEEAMKTGTQIVADDRGNGTLCLGWSPFSAFPRAPRRPADSESASSRMVALTAKTTGKMTYIRVETIYFDS